MATRPILPLDVQAAIERTRDAVLHHAIVTFNLIFPRLDGGVEASLVRPLMPMPASVKQELGAHASNLFDAEAQHYLGYSHSESELRAWLNALADAVTTGMMDEAKSKTVKASGFGPILRMDHTKLRASVLNSHCSPTEQSGAIRDALSDRVNHWAKNANEAPEVSWSDKAVRVQEQERTEQIIRPVNSDRAAQGDRPKDELDIAQPTRAVEEAEATEPFEADEITRRTSLLEDYRADPGTGNPSNRSIYRAKDSGIHKPQFYEWRDGRLSRDSETSKNFERFLRDKKPPIPRKPRP
jgi:hypothetical protein